MGREQDPRIGKDVVAKDGTFAGHIVSIMTCDDGTEQFVIEGYSVLTDTRGLISGIQAAEVVAWLKEDECLFQ